MAHIVSCSACGSQYQAEDHQMGTRLYCGICGSTFTAQAPAGAAVPPPAPPAYAQDNTGNGRAVASLVLGIVAIPTCIYYGIISLVCGILAVVLGVSARNSIRRGEMPPSAAGMAKAGVICGWVGIGLSVLLWAVVVTVFLLASR